MKFERNRSNIEIVSIQGSDLFVGQKDKTGKMTWFQYGIYGYIFLVVIGHPSLRILPRTGGNLVHGDQDAAHRV